MSQRDGYPEGTAANLNIAGTHRPLVSRRRIEHLKQLAYDCNLTAEQARKYGKLSKTATWEALLLAYGIPLHPVDSNVDSVDSKAQSLDTSDWTSDASFPVCNFTPQNSINFLSWVDFGQLIALALASAGVFVLAMSLWRQINPLNLFPPVRINIQIGTKL